MTSSVVGPPKRIQKASREERKRGLLRELGSPVEFSKADERAWLTDPPGRFYDIRAQGKRNFDLLGNLDGLP